jgi:hypothetical protein
MPSSARALANVGVRAKAIASACASVTTCGTAVGAGPTPTPGTGEPYAGKGIAVPTLAGPSVYCGKGVGCNKPLGPTAGVITPGPGDKACFGKAEGRGVGALATRADGGAAEARVPHALPAIDAVAATTIRPARRILGVLTLRSFGRCIELLLPSLTRF